MNTDKLTSRPTNNKKTQQSETATRGTRAVNQLNEYSVWIVVLQAVVPLLLNSVQWQSSTRKQR